MWLDSRSDRLEASHRNQRAGPHHITELLAIIQHQSSIIAGLDGCLVHKQYSIFSNFSLLSTVGGGHFVSSYMNPHMKLSNEWEWEWRCSWGLGSGFIEFHRF